jgi:hypothetical protein
MLFAVIETVSTYVPQKIFNKKLDVLIPYPKSEQMVTLTILLSCSFETLPCNNHSSHIMDNFGPQHCVCLLCASLY